MTDDRWDALSPQEARRLFDEFDAPWWVAGGWALDLFLGRQTRPHGDIDLAILRDDQPRLRRHLTGWDVQVAHDGELTPWAQDDWLAPPRHQFWARPAADAAWALEILLEDHDGDDWLFRRLSSLRRPLDAIGAATADGVPYISPEVALLYKGMRRRSTATPQTLTSPRRHSPPPRASGCTTRYAPCTRATHGSNA